MRFDQQVSGAAVCGLSRVRQGRGLSSPIDFSGFFGVTAYFVADLEAGTPIHVFVEAGILPAQLPTIT
jgi:hypothetical protein